MRRPTRTRRLSIAAIASLLGFVVVAAAAIRSFRVASDTKIGWRNDILLEGGYITYLHIYQTREVRDQSGNLKWPIKFRWIGGGFRVGQWILTLYKQYTFVQCGIELPVWFPLLLLLIAPVRWLIARPANAPAFPVIANKA